MEDQVAAGIFVIDGSTFVRTDSGLVRLSELSGSGPQGEQGVQGEQWPPGDKGDQGDPGVVNLDNVYTRAQVELALMANKPTSDMSTGAKVYDSTTNTIRNIVGQNGLPAFIYMDPTNPNNPQTTHWW